MSNLQKWNEDRVETLLGLVGTNTETEVAATVQATAAEALGVSTRSIAAKLRNMGYTTASTAASTAPKYTPEQEEELRAFIESNPAMYTYAEIAGHVLGGVKTAKEIQGKILSMELFDKVKPTPKLEVAKKYSDEEETRFIALMVDGAFLEDIATAMGRPINSVRGKALSLNRMNSELAIPKQRESHAVTKANPFDAIDNLGELTVAEIAELIEKTERGVKTMLTRRGIDCKDYAGAKKAAKNAESEVAAA